MTTRAPQPYRQVPGARRWGAAPAQLANVALGLWLLASPFLLAYSPAARQNTWLTGMAITGGAIVAVRRPGARWLTMAVSAWLAFSSSLLWPAGLLPRWNNLVTAFLVFAVSFAGGARATSPRKAPPTE